MGADLDIMLLSQPHRLRHHRRIGGVEAAGDIGDGNVRHQTFIVAHLVEAEAFAHVAIDLDLGVRFRCGHRLDLLYLRADRKNCAANILINNSDLMKPSSALRAARTETGELIVRASAHRTSGVLESDTPALHFKMKALA